MKVTPEKQNKRRNLLRWQNARHRRLCCKSFGQHEITERQSKRADQLATAINRQEKS